MYLRKCPITNFGDDLNLFLVRKISSEEVIVVNQHFKPPAGEIIHLVIGSLLRWADRNTVVWGTGYQYLNARVRERPLKICAVRGRLTREQLLQQGFDCPQVYGDPALLLPRYYKPTAEIKFKLGIMPHYVDQNSATLDKFRREDGVLFINALSPVEKIVDDINSCERIASSCLHGIVVADAYKIPSTWIKLSNKVIGKGFKFRDYFSSVGRRMEEPLILSNGTTLESIFESFGDYEIDIDLDRLHDVCPFKDGEK